MKYLWTVVLLSFLLVAGCAPTWTHPEINGTWVAPGHAYVCLQLPEKQMPAAKEAVDAWDRSLRQWKRFIAVEGTQDVCTYVVREVTEAHPEDEHALAWASSLGGHEISMRRGRYEHDTTGILLHELGHALGAQHVPGTLMNARWYRHGFICPDAPTVAQVAAWNKVNLATLSWCYP